MAGSFNHIITDHGNLVSNERFTQMIENLGDVYEMTEEMFGMIWWLAHSEDSCVDPVAAIKAARDNYQAGLRLAKADKTKGWRNGG